MNNADHIRAMSDEELAQIIMCPYDNGHNSCIPGSNCLDCCVKWLQQPYESSTGYIEKDALKDIVKRYFEIATYANIYSLDTVDTAHAMCGLIDGVEKADVAPVRHGSWFDRGSLSCRCSECGCKNNRETPWCPTCGARMDESGTQPQREDI